mmetsp:Transcript_21335/g.63757  ORF Transcript_21335/g.63757 Transcript_21335/m.63757 type:complete len:357 (+) Transcript_21335:441-1511(+)
MIMSRALPGSLSASTFPRKASIHSSSSSRSMRSCSELSEAASSSSEPARESSSSKPKGSAPCSDLARLGLGPFLAARSFLGCRGRFDDDGPPASTAAAASSSESLRPSSTLGLASAFEGPDAEGPDADEGPAAAARLAFSSASCSPQTFSTTYLSVSAGAESRSSASAASPAAAAAFWASCMRFAWASPVDWRPTTTHLPSARAALASSTSLSTLLLVMRLRKKRWWAPQSWPCQTCLFLPCARMRSSCSSASSGSLRVALSQRSSASWSLASLDSMRVCRICHSCAARSYCCTCSLVSAASTTSKAAPAYESVRQRSAPSRFRCSATSSMAPTPRASQALTKLWMASIWFALMSS